MAFSWAGVKTWAKEFWQKLTRPQKVITIVAPLLVLIALSSLIIWAGRTEYVPLFSKISDTEAGQITAKLKDLKVSYKLEDGGTTILVPQKQVDEARLELANDGLPQNSKFSFDYLNQTRLGETDADSKVRYTLALQNELEETLKTMNGVQDARVHIVMPDQTLFADKQNPTTAAVTLNLVPGTKISDQQIHSIASLMASSVEGLTTDNVTIVDTEGNTLSDVLSSNNSNSLDHLSVTQLQYQQQIEDNTEKSVQSMLDKTLGSGKAVVRVNATLDFDQTHIVQETHGPGALESQQNTTQSSSNTTGNGTTAGVQSNVPGYQTPTTGGGTSTSNSSSTTQNYKVDTTQRDQTVAPGAIKRLSVSVMADSDKVTQDQLTQIQALVSSAAGLDPTRGDQIQVAALPFDKSGALADSQAMADAAKRQQIVTYIEIGLAVLAALVLGAFYLRARSKKKKQAQMELMGTEGETAQDDKEFLESQRLAEQEAEMSLARKNAKTSEEIEKQKVKAAVDDYTKKNPDEVARLLKSWLAEEK